MKKLLAVVLAVIMLVSTASAGAAGIEIFKEPMRNYTSDMKLSMSFNTANELVSALQELGMDLSETVENEMIDFVPFLESLFNISGTAKVKSDISEDYNRIRVSMEAGYDYGVELNGSLSVSADIKQSMWMEIDLTDVANPKYYMVMLSPLSTKYTYIDLFEGMAEEEKLMTVVMLKSFINKDFIDTVNAEMAKIYEEYSAVSDDGKKLTISIDNDGFLKMFDKIIELFVARLSVIIPGFSESMAEVQIPKLSDFGIKLLGEKGMVIECTEDGVMLSSCDIYININEIYYQFTGIELPTENDLVIGFTASEEQILSEIGTTEIVFPELTEENSINLGESLYMQPEDEYYEEDYYEEYEPTYPNIYSDVYFDYMPSVDGKLYVPFRMALEDAYEEHANITYENGVVTVTSEYFTDMEKLTFKVGETKANVDGFDFEVGEIVLENGVTYVSTDFFEIIFDWNLDWATYDYLWGKYNIGFYTYSFEDEYYDEW